MPTREVVERALKALKRAADYEYFFSRLDSPAWIEPLWQAKFFRQPPEPIRDGDYIRFPLWPESQYLARMASKAPDIVSRIAVEIPPTENVRVHEDLADIALQLPPEMSARFVPAVETWLRSPYQFLLPEKLGKLVSRLTRGRQMNAALKLARVLFEVVPGRQRPRADSLEESRYELIPEPAGRFDDSEYADILRECLPDLLAADGIATIILVCDLLECAIRLALRDADAERPRDFSYIWRQAIDADSPTDGIRNVLVSGVRDAATQLAQRDPAMIPRIIESLEKRGWEVFERLALDVLNRFSAQTPDLVFARLARPSYYDRAGIRREYQALLHNQFVQAPPHVQDEIVAWIQAGPSAEEMQRFAEWRKAESQPISDEDLQAYTDGWKLRRLAPIADYVPAELRRQYSDFLRQVAEAQQEERPVVGATWVGPTSPKTSAELHALSVEELTIFLRTWAPPGEMFTPSPEGLGRTLTEVVASDPEKYASKLTLFVGLDPTYVRAAIQGFSNAAKQGRTFSWRAVLALCAWVLGQPQETKPAGERVGERDLGWKWTRNEIARLLSTGLARTGPREIPFELRTDIWRVLEPLTDDPDPTPDDEARHKESWMDALSLSINTIRGNAIHALIDYSLWVWRHLEEVLREAGFARMPEVKPILERHLDLARDSSLAIRAVYGQRFPWLLLLDNQWSAAHVKSIFPPDNLLREFFDAAWVAYIKFCEPYNNVFDVLKGEYAMGISRLEAYRADQRHFTDYSTRLAEHLAVFYGRGKLNFGDRPALLEKFYETADLKTRSHVLSYVGWNLEHALASMPGSTIERFQALWVRRSDELLGQDVSRQDREELSSFASWFASGAFDDRWAVDQLLKVLRGGVMPDPLHTVLRRLASLAPAFQGEVLECLELMLDIDKRGERIRFFGEEIRAAISGTMKSPDRSVQEKAIALVHRLGSFGLREYRDLLPGD